MSSSPALHRLRGGRDRGLLGAGGESGDVAGLQPLGDFGAAAAERAAQHFDGVLAQSGSGSSDGGGRAREAPGETAVAADAGVGVFKKVPPAARGELRVGEVGEGGVDGAGRDADALQAGLQGLRVPAARPRADCGFERVDVGEAAGSGAPLFAIERGVGAGDAQQRRPGVVIGRGDRDPLVLALAGEAFVRSLDRAAVAVARDGRAAGGGEQGVFLDVAECGFEH